MKRRYKICPHCKREIEVEFVKEFGDDYLIEKARADERNKTIDECINAINDFCGRLPNNNLIAILKHLKEKKNG